MYFSSLDGIAVTLSFLSITECPYQICVDNDNQLSEGAARGLKPGLFVAPLILFQFSQFVANAGDSYVRARRIFA